MKWSTLQSKVHGLNLDNLVDKNFINKLKEEFEDKDIDIVTLQIAVRDKVKDPSDEPTLDVISLANKSVEDTLLNDTIVDVNFEENFDKIKKVLNEYEKESI